MNKKEFYQKQNLTEAQFDGTEEIGGYLYLRSLTSIPEGFKKEEMEWKTISFLSWKNEQFILCDGRFSEAIKYRKNIWQLKDVNRDNKYYLS